MAKNVVQLVKCLPDMHKVLGSSTPIFFFLRIKIRENNNEIIESLSITIYLLFCRGGWASFETGFYCTIPDGLKLKDDPPASAL